LIVTGNQQFCRPELKIREQVKTAEKLDDNKTIAFIFCPELITIAEYK
jgi:hypothetical protein